MSALHLSLSQPNLLLTFHFSILDLITVMANPQRIIELQKFYQTSTKPLWRAHPNAKLVLIPYFAAFTVSLGAALFFTGRAAFGIKASK
jgi:cytochrome c oxidase subunit 7